MLYSCLNLVWSSTAHSFLFHWNVHSLGVSFDVEWRECTCMSISDLWPAAALSLFCVLSVCECCSLGNVCYWTEAEESGGQVSAAVGLGSSPGVVITHSLIISSKSAGITEPMNVSRGHRNRRSMIPGLRVWFRDWQSSSVLNAQVLATQMCSISRTLAKELGVVAYACNPSTGKAKVGNSLGLACYPVQPN